MASESDVMMNSTNSSLGTEDMGESNEKIFTIVLYVLVGTVGIVGNAMVCVVFSLIRSRRSQVNLFIRHQAIVDLCTSCLLIMFGVTQLYRDEIMQTSYELINSSLSTPNASDSSIGYTEEYVKVANIPLGLAEFMCRVWWGRVLLFSMFSISTFNLMSMAIERYIAIKHPFFYATKFNRRHALMVITLAWLLAPVFQYFPPIFQYDAMDDTHECGYQSEFTATAQAAVGVVLFTWEFIMPSFVMGFSSIRIFRELRHRDSYLVKATNYLMERDKGHVRDRPPPEKQPELVKANRNTTMVVIIMFVVYIICWAPNHITFLGFNLGMELDFTGKWYQTTVLLAFVNSCINPFIYAIRLKTFQRGFVHVCRMGCKPISSARFDSTETLSRYRVKSSVF